MGKIDLRILTIADECRLFVCLFLVTSLYVKAYAKAQPLVSIANLLFVYVEQTAIVSRFLKGNDIL